MTKANSRVTMDGNLLQSGRSWLIEFTDQASNLCGLFEDGIGFRWVSLE